MQKQILIVLFFVHAMPLMAQTTLSGKIGNMTIDSSGNPYIISDNMTVPSGKTLTIEAGAILLFKPFTGLIIEGSLVVEGQLEKPVTFTTENDARFNTEAKQLPNPFDWNGILITQKAEFVKLTNFILEYSVYGVKSQKEEFIISNGTFVHNGQFHVTVKDAIKNVVDDIPFNFGKESDGGNGQPGKAQQTTGSSDNRTPAWKKPVGVGLVVAGAAALGVGGYFFYRASNYNSQYNSAPTKKMADEYTAKSNSSLIAAIACAAGGGISVVGGIILITRKPAKEKNVTVAPILGNYNGISIVFDY